MNAILQADRKLFSAIYAISGKSPFVDRAIVFLSDTFIFVVLGSIAAWYIYKFAKGRLVFSSIASLLLSVGFTTVAYTVLKNVFMRLRPFAELGIPHLVNDASYALPSGHTATLFAVATSVWFVNEPLGFLIGICGLVVGIARVAGGVHWPLDIFGGAILGIFAAIVVRKCISLVLKK